MHGIVNKYSNKLFTRCIWFFFLFFFFVFCFFFCFFLYIYFLLFFFFFFFFFVLFFRSIKLTVPLKIKLLSMYFSSWYRRLYQNNRSPHQKSNISLHSLLKSEISSVCCDITDRFVSALVRNTDCYCSHAKARLYMTFVRMLCHKTFILSRRMNKKSKTNLQKLLTSYACQMLLMTFSYLLCVF